MLQTTDLANLCIELYSTVHGRRRQSAHTYLASFVGYPDEGSEFDQKIGMKKHLFRIPFIGRLATALGLQYLKKQGYDAIIAYEGEHVIGHTAFQVHEDNTLHVFSTAVKEEYRSRRYGVLLWKAVIEHARTSKITDVRLGAGGHPFAVRAYELVCRKAEELRIEPKEDYWITVTHVTETTVTIHPLQSRKE